ncbi:hypothetical protein C5167_011690 [Papaver somniferum]|uniref:Uncharacterized protein n=1 Tax=Papaver somniferum TaxID=3469 RepID=A0A4Y7K3U2_PAPSO|nr:hypothetical protein C5167_011690 [Papaver somniferum]
MISCCRRIILPFLQIHSELGFKTGKLSSAAGHSNLRDYKDIFLEEIDPMDEWVGGGDVERDL